MNKLLSLFLSIFLINSSMADEINSTRPDSHAPIGVMGEHTHKAGEVMLSYRYMSMDMDGNRDGTSRKSNSDVLENFMITPTDMRMEMHMLGLMYAPTDKITLMTMIPVVELSMNHLTRMGGRFKTNSSGLGDIKITGLLNAAEFGSHKFIINSGISLPSGEIDERDATPINPSAKLPYPMQLGSGTVDLLPGITYLGQSKDFSWGAQGIGTLRLGRNDNDYSLGERFESSIWGAFYLCDAMSASFRTSWSIWGDIDGADPDLNPRMVPTADPTRRAGRRVDFGIGLNFLVPEGSFEGLRFATEFVFPVYQNLDGPQLETDGTWIFGIQGTL